MSADAWTVVESFLEGKTGRPETCEDGLIATGFYPGVVDGVTAKSERSWSGRSGGREAARIIATTLARLPAGLRLREVVDALTAGIYDRYREADCVEPLRDDPNERMGASMALLDPARREVWRVGDCQVMVNGELLTRKKTIDHITANVRALYLETALLSGEDLEALRREDPGRAHILPLLRQQAVFQNRPEAGDLWYPVIDGFPVPEAGLEVIALPDTAVEVVLSTDGYPAPRATLAESERLLFELLERDPLLFREFKATKGLRPGQVSFDDRAYLRIRLDPV